MDLRLLLVLSCTTGYDEVLLVSRRDALSLSLAFHGVGRDVSNGLLVDLIRLVEPLLLV